MKKLLIVAMMVLLSTAPIFSQLNFTANPVCFGDVTMLTAPAKFSDTLIASWKWDFDNDLIWDDTVTNKVYNLFPQADTFPVTLRVKTIYGYEHTTTQQVIVYPLPEVNFTVANVCEQDSAIFTDISTVESGSTINQYIWDFDNNGSGNAYGKTVKFYVGAAGVEFTTKLECITDKGCRGSRTQHFEVYSRPDVGFVASNKCAGQNTLFVNNSTSNDNIANSIWDFGDNSEPAVSDGNISHMYEASGNYTVKLIVETAHQCIDSASITISVNPVPEITFWLNGDTLIYEGERVTIMVQENYPEYKWYFKSGGPYQLTGNTSNSIEATQRGRYAVVVTDNNGCRKSESVDIYVKQVNSIVVENDILTPNGDGVNDFLIVKDIEAHRDLNLVVYNIWGEKVFYLDEGCNYYNNWGGTYGGGKNILPPGAYYYVITSGTAKVKGCINILQ